MISLVGKTKDDLKKIICSLHRILSVHHTANDLIEPLILQSDEGRTIQSLLSATHKLKLFHE
jgi:hypothetical protein